jgi:hypothetical protein
MTAVPLRPCFRFVLCAAIAFVVMGCAVGRQHEYRVQLPVFLEGRGRVAVAVHDQRPDVVDGSEDLDYVGMQRAGFGNPWDVTTESGNALAEDWARTVVDALHRGGFAGEVVSTSPAQAHLEVVSRLRATRADALVLFTVHAWHSDTFGDTTVHRDVVLEVIEPSGRLLAVVRSGGDRELYYLGLDEAGNAEREVPRTFQKTLEWMFANVRVQHALLAATGSPAAGQLRSPLEAPSSNAQREAAPPDR